MYAVALGSSFGAASSAPVLRDTSQALAEQNLRRHRVDLPAVLDGFVADVAARTGGGGGHGVEGDRGSSGLSVGEAVVFLAVLAALYPRCQGFPFPERHPPCLFDPGHGPLVRDVECAGFGDGGPSEVASATEVRRNARGRTADERRDGRGPRRFM
ncbi:hypothetical protein [Streptomyces javensis]|uniref:Uncharacterized protein n=2 Tax=Streptomyces javensis TaxID=114698 RepID=A0ABS0REH6_9ACTN|nr:hypothetical protein [Streptomyces javensis]MBI0315809.1 hypothetical protein [Streptomyces javensis]